MVTRVPVFLFKNPYEIVSGVVILPGTGDFCAGFCRRQVRRRQRYERRSALCRAGNLVARTRGPAATLITVPPGENSKSLASAERLCDEMIAAGLDRGAFVAALGGGVVGDLAGFAAAIYYRGIPHVQIPTTVVAQVDSAIGGKTGVNARDGKNLIGCFHQPVLVIADTATLATLPRREFNEGVAEVVNAVTMTRQC